MKNISVKLRILLNAVAFMLILGFSGIFSVLEVNDIEDQAKKLESHYFDAFSYISKIQSITKENFILTTEIIYSKNKSFSKNKWEEIQKNNRTIDQLESEYHKLIDSDDEQQLYNVFDDDKIKYSQVITNVVDISKSGNQDKAQQLLQTDLYPIYYEFQNVIQKIEKFNEIRAHEAGDRILKDVILSRKAILISLIIGFILAIASSIYLSKSIVVLIDEVKKTVIKVNSSVTELAATSKEQQATSNEITSTTSEIGATSKEITTNSVELMKTIESVTLVSEDTAKIASSGQNELKNMEDGMRGILNASGSINEKLATLNEKAGNINSVVTTINKISDQTNLLSLNAAIEAEKAGEYGRGFSVVSNEIRRLADQTAVATFDIEQTVKEIQSAVSSSVMEMDKFSEEVKRGEEEVQKIVEQMEQIIELVQTLTPQFDQVREGMDSQTIGANQINDALSQLLDAMEQSSISIRESVESIDILKNASFGLQSVVTKM